MKVKSFSHVRLFVTPWTAAYSATLSMGFSRQEYWSGLPFPSLGDLLDPRIEPGSSALQADSLPSEPPATRENQGHKQIEESRFGPRQLGFSNELISNRECFRHRAKKTSMMDVSPLVSTDNTVKSRGCLIPGTLLLNPHRSCVSEVWVYIHSSYR